MRNVINLLHSTLLKEDDDLETAARTPLKMAT